MVAINPGSWSWEVDRPSLRHWMQTLIDRFHVDRPAVLMLYNLSIHSIHGYEEANSIIVWKIVKKKADFTAVKNHAAFVKKSVDNAWWKLFKELG